jgi:hypothetical protein
MLSDSALPLSSGIAFSVTTCFVAVICALKFYSFHLPSSLVRMLRRLMTPPSWLQVNDNRKVTKCSPGVCLKWQVALPRQILHQVRTRTRVCGDDIALAVAPSYIVYTAETQSSAKTSSSYGREWQRLAQRAPSRYATAALFSVGVAYPVFFEKEL